MDRGSYQIAALQIVKMQHPEDHRVKDHRHGRQRGDAHHREKDVLFVQMLLRDDRCDGQSCRGSANGDRSARKKPEGQRAPYEPGGGDADAQGEKQERCHSGNRCEAKFGHAVEGQPQPQKRNAHAEEQL